MESYCLDNNIDKYSVRSQLMKNILRSIANDLEEGSNVINLKLLTKAFFLCRDEACRDEALIDSDVAKLQYFFDELADTHIGEEDFERDKFDFSGVTNDGRPVLSYMYGNYYKVDSETLQKEDEIELPDDLQYISDTISSYMSNEYAYLTRNMKLEDDE